ncbi:MAG: hypothetical protein PVI21_06360 [Candidatus Woesebacteria bacterium]
MSKSKILKFLQSHKLLLICIFIVGLLVASVVIPLCMSDGTENYTGRARQATAGGMLLDGTDRFGRMIFKIRVDDVIPMPDSASIPCAYTKPRDASLEKQGDRSLQNTSKYIVVISYRTFFGIKESVSQRFVCY